jgi:formylglycine-generating enzyme required for sulfatase activity
MVAFIQLRTIENPIDTVTFGVDQAMDEDIEAAVEERKSAERQARAQEARRIRDRRPRPMTHAYKGPMLERVPVQLSRKVVESDGFFGLRKRVRHEPYWGMDERMVLRSQQRSAERFVVHGIDFTLVHITPGEYIVGSLKGTGSRAEHPQHLVQFTKRYGIGVHAVTQELWEAVTGSNPSLNQTKLDCRRHPVENISWHDAVGFCNALSEYCGLKPAYRFRRSTVLCDFRASGFRLPTEHEWEVAARAGTHLRYAGGDVSDDVAWHRGNSDSATQAVGQKTANSWGLYDMSGNVWEWCWDWHDADAYRSTQMTDPQGPDYGALRVFRGGGYFDSESFSRVTFRYQDFVASRRSGDLGFRLTRTLS